MSFRPKILVVGLELLWPGAARLPRALQDAGFEVGVACRAKSLLALTKFRDHFSLLPDKKYGRSFLLRLEEIVDSWPPDFLLPTDDWTALFLARVYELIACRGNSNRLAGLLKRSLGNPPAIHEAASKRRTLEVARHLGVRVPASRTVVSRGEILKFAGTHGFPIVLKRSFDNGGNGVFVCKNETEVAMALDFLHREKKLNARLNLWRERLRGRVMERRWLPSDRSITVSQFIAGKCAMSLAAAAEGQMLAALTAEAEETYPDAKGPSTVVRFVCNEEMRRASEVLLNHWRLTGLIGFDFMLDAAGQAWLIECNPRPTPIAHLGGRVGEDLLLALHRWLVSGQQPPRNTAPPTLMVAHFPQETWRDPNSPYLASAFHDIPSDDPDLLNCLKQIQPTWRNR
jgi:hypothetical protein